MSRFGLALLLLCSSQLHGQSDSKDLSRITPAASLLFHKNDGVCITGRVKSANTDLILIESYGSADEEPTINSLSRTEVTFIGESLSAHDVIFSSRSSWIDVMEANPTGFQEEFRIKLKSGKTVSGKPRKVTETSITLNQFIGHNELRKVDIATIDYVRAKPISDAMQYLRTETPWLLLFDPEFYYRASGLPGKLTIRLYDASKAEDNTRLSCKFN